MALELALELLTTTAVITGVGVVGDTLYVIGTDQDDHVTINQAGSVYRAHADFLTTDSYRDVSMAGVSRIVVQVCDGDDHVTVSAGVSLPTIIDGGNDDDHLNGGNGPNVILGGDGDDMLVGGNGNDILIGGDGADRIVGNTGDDILIAGRTAYDANDAALMALMTIWNTSPSNGRVAAIQNTSNTYYLIENDFSDTKPRTVFSDNAVDQLTGSSGTDLFFAESGDDAVKDIITDLKGELALDIDL